jgi:malate dehydrogenase (oxaloacetate-decarboxylating)
MIAVVTDGSAVLGLGNIGPEAGMPVMEGKCVLFKAFAGIDAFPLCIQSQDVDTIVETIYQISGSFGGINLEDIAAPWCFEIEKRLKERCDIPIFHDDQHGTAVVVAAALINAMKLAKRELGDQKVVICGAGAAGTACANLLIKIGVKNLILCDKDGIISRGKSGMNGYLNRMAEITNPENICRTLADALAGADVFVGVSTAGVLSRDMIKTMNPDPVIFAMANPNPEIMPEEAKAAGAFVVGTGRSDFDNQINNVLAFPGIFRGVLDVRASDINDEMKIAAAYALAGIIKEEELSAAYVIPQAFDKRVGPAVAAAVADAARRTGAAQI